MSCSINRILHTDQFHTPCASHKPSVFLDILFEIIPLVASGENCSYCSINNGYI
ncbi:Uncharacterised protein [Klebsiella pneumoniae]|nr:Uncharacterised protein [Klebsiella pneumoniae]